MFTYYHDFAGRMVAFTKSNDNQTTWMFSDIINSTSVTRNEAGEVTLARYTPWGERRGTTPQLPTDHTFTGQIQDRSTGLSFYNARYYDPIVGRFISPDTVIPDLTNGQSYNRYTYVLNNPVLHTDSSGNCSDYLPCSPNAPTTTDQADVSLGTSFKTPAGHQHVPGSFLNPVLNHLGGACIAASAGCDANAGGVGALKQGIVDTSAGYLQGLSSGLADDVGLIPDDIAINENSALYTIGELGGIGGQYVAASGYLSLIHI